MEGKQYNKLVRDKIPEFLDSKGIPYEKKTLEEHEYVEQLFKKLNEEVGEFLKSKTIEEFADVLQVIEEIKQLPEFNDVESIRLNKLNEKGGFKNRFMVKGIDDR